ncbi:hypothetical protein LguiA_029868 [Lonicera macranthoides]
MWVWSGGWSKPGRNPRYLTRINSSTSATWNDQMLRVLGIARSCTHDEQWRRPTMPEVVKKLKEIKVKNGTCVLGLNEKPNAQIGTGSGCTFQAMIDHGYAHNQSWKAGLMACLPLDPVFDSPKYKHHWANSRSSRTE